MPCWALEVVLLSGTALRAAAVTAVSTGASDGGLRAKRVTHVFWGLW